MAPSSGLLLLLGGAGLLAGGVGNLATAPICKANAIRSSAQPLCLGLSIGFGVALTGAGIPLLVLGARQRDVWARWRRERGADVVLAAVTGGASMAWRGTW